MKQNLQLKLTQQLAMTPQLQQAIRLLQLSTLDLQQEIQLALENNPLLEQVDSFDEITVLESLSDESLDSSDALTQEIPDTLPLDATWDEIYTAGTPSGMQSDYYAEDFPVYQGETKQNLQDYLIWQMGLTPFSETDLAIATSIIDAIDNSGYLTVPLTDIVEGMGNNEIELAEVEAVLKRIHHFDPVGIGARDLRECLLIQLSQLNEGTPYLAEAKQIISKHLLLLGQRDFRSLMRLAHLTEDDLKEAIDLIQSFNPRPGDVIDIRETEYVIPDILVVKKGNRWIADLNYDSIPRVRINQSYAAFEHNGNENDNQFIHSHLQEARWLIKSIESRNETLLKVAHCIIERQQEFFEFGEAQMKPMILADIAQTVNMHESTISRVTTQKYLHCPRGIFELKYFFSSHVSTDSGGEASSIAIRAVIKKLITEENTQKPLSDSKIVSLLAKEGMVVARRTVAKYRESLSIPPSNQRKQLL